MWPYIITFTLSSVLFGISGRFKKNQQFIFEWLGIFVLCLLAGFRASTIGTDTEGYLRPLIDFAIKSSNFSEYWNSTWVANYWMVNVTSQYEAGFTLFIYIITKITQSVVATQFCIQLLIIVPIYIVLKNSDGRSLWLGMLVFDCLLFNHSLNMIRQSIAMSFVLCGVFEWIKEKRKNAIIIITTSCFFHLCGLIGFVFIGIYKFLDKEKNRSNEGTRKEREKSRFRMLVIVGLLLVVSAHLIAVILSKLGVSRFLMYIDGSISLMPRQILLRFLGLLLFLYNFNRIKSKIDTESYFLLLMILYEIFAAQFAGVNEYSVRIAQMFTVFDIISYPTAVKYSKYRVLNQGLMIGYLIVYWLFYFGFGGMARTVPYVFLN